MNCKTSTLSEQEESLQCITYVHNKGKKDKNLTKYQLVCVSVHLNEPIQRADSMDTLHHSWAAFSSVATDNYSAPRLFIINHDFIFKNLPRDRFTTCIRG